MKVSNTTRIAFALTMVAATVLLCLRLLGLFDDDGKKLLAGRVHLCETVSVACSQFVSKGDNEGVTAILTAMVQRNEEILSAAIRKPDGTLLVDINEHSKHWKPADNGKSTNNCIYVPVLAKDRPWGRVEVSYKSLVRAGPLGLFGLPSVRVILGATLLNMMGFFLCLKRSLKHVDPSRAVPDRVRSALDNMAEGLLVVNDKNRVVLANHAFAEKANVTVNAVQGKRVSELPWKIDQQRSDQDAVDFIWRRREFVNGLPDAKMIRVTTKANVEKTFMIKATRIKDNDGNSRGMLVSFDDISALEQKNYELTEMLQSLNQSQAEIKRQNKKLQHLATRDPLTSCLNRRALFKIFEDQWNSAKRYGHPLSCVMLDIDHFKSVNDNHGHSTGDEVLKGVATAIDSASRETDFVGRFGGEEFCIILPHVALQDALTASERFRKVVEELPLSVPVTISLGVSSVEFGAADVAELIDQADKSLYIAKESGRNRSVGYNAAIDHQDVPAEKDVATFNAQEETAADASVLYGALSDILRDSDKASAILQDIQELLHLEEASS